MSSWKNKELTPLTRVHAFFVERVKEITRTNFEEAQAVVELSGDLVAWLDEVSKATDKAVEMLRSHDRAERMADVLTDYLRQDPAHRRMDKLEAALEAYDLHWRTR